MTLVIDANVVVKWFLDEPGSEQARAYFNSVEPLLAPAHMLAEVGEALVRSWRKGELPQEQLDLARVVLRQTFVVLPLGDLISSALDIAIAAQISHYEALYVAAAERRDTHLITDDRVLLRKLAGTERVHLARPLVPLN